MSAERASRILDYGHQLVEHVWMWTENVERYYADEANPVLRRPVRPVRRLRSTVTPENGP